VRPHSEHEVVSRPRRRKSTKRQLAANYFGADHDFDGVGMDLDAFQGPKAPGAKKAAPIEDNKWRSARDAIVNSHYSSVVEQRSGALEAVHSRVECWQRAADEQNCRECLRGSSPMSNTPSPSAANSGSQELSRAMMPASCSSLNRCTAAPPLRTRLGGGSTPRQWWSLPVPLQLPQVRHRQDMAWKGQQKVQETPSAWTPHRKTNRRRHKHPPERGTAGNTGTLPLLW
jgi:hypothetical protein